MRGRLRFGAVLQPLHGLLQQRRFAADRERLVGKEELPDFDVARDHHPTALRITRLGRR